MKKFVPVIVERACLFAVKNHGDQMYGKVPYYYHLRAVVSTMQAFSIWDKRLLAAGYLHDVIEDTPVLKEELVSKFSPYIADIVDACTDGEGATREERKVRPYRLIPTVPGAVTVKIADRLANVIACRIGDNSNEKLARQYAEEHAGFMGLYYCIPAEDLATQTMARILDQQLASLLP